MRWFPATIETVRAAGSTFDAQLRGSALHGGRHREVRGRRRGEVMRVKIPGPFGLVGERVSHPSVLAVGVGGFRAHDRGIHVVFTDRHGVDGRAGVGIVVVLAAERVRRGRAPQGRGLPPAVGLGNAAADRRARAVFP